MTLLRGGGDEGAAGGGGHVGGRGGGGGSALGRGRGVQGWAVQVDNVKARAAAERERAFGVHCVGARRAPMFSAPETIVSYTAFKLCFVFQRAPVHQGGGGRGGARHGGGGGVSRGGVTGGHDPRAPAR